MATRKLRRSTRFVKETTNGQRKPTSDAPPVYSLPSSKPRVERKSTDEGQPKLQIVFPSVRRLNGPFALDVSAFLAVPQLADFLAHGLMLRLGSTPNVNTATSYRNDLIAGIVKFLKEHLPNIGITNLSRSLMTAYINWLDATVNEQARLSIASRAGYYVTFKRLVEVQRRSKGWKFTIPSDLTFPHNPWPNQNSYTNHKPALNDDLITRIRLACMKEVKETIDSVNRAQDALHGLRAITLTLDQLFRGAHQHVGHFLTLYFLSLEITNGCIPSYRELPSAIKTMMRVNGISYSDAAIVFHPTPRRLVPFVILLALAGSQNADVARNFKLTDYRRSTGLVDFIALATNRAASSARESEAEPAPSEELQLFPMKPRAHKRQWVFLPIDDEVDHPAVIIEFVKAWSEKLREHVPATIKNHLFIFATSNSVYRMTTFSGQEGSSAPSTWTGCLNAFRADHRLEPFTLENIRPTSLDVTWEVFDGDARATATQANHTKVSTTEKSYLTEAEKQRQYEKLSRITEHRTRWRETNGLIDPRDRSSELDGDCATPGWSCIDTYDSPYTPKGKMCSAYGRCPDCPLGNVDLNSALSYAFSVNLLDAINRAQTSMSPDSWNERWAPVKKKLEKRWLICFSPRAVREARRLDFPPMPLPE